MKNDQLLIIYGKLYPNSDVAILNVSQKDEELDVH